VSSPLTFIDGQGAGCCLNEATKPAPNVAKRQTGLKGSPGLSSPHASQVNSAEKSYSIRKPHD
ncbi:MAG: hypothetical protein Q9214_000112, partial [Letrouitia sp. 1 TL-2023]